MRELGNRLSIFTRIVGALMAVTLVTLGVGALALSRISVLQDTRNREVGEQAPLLAALQEAALTAKAAANDERGYLLTRDETFTEEFAGRIEKVYGALDRAEALADPAGKTAIEDIRSGVRTWASAVTAEFAQAKTDKAGAVAAAMGPNRDLRKAYEDALTTAIGAAAENLAAGTTFAATVKSARVAVLVLLIAGIALALTTGVLIARSIAGRLRRQVGVLEQVADGDLRVRAVRRRHRRGGPARHRTQHDDRIHQGCARPTVGVLAHPRDLGAADGRDRSLDSRGRLSVGR